MNLKAPFLLIAGAVTALAADRPAKPNVILLLTDDLGWQDVKCYDIDEPSPMETPNLDALAKDGVMFWQAYSPAPTCGPSRSAIMSGNHPARSNMTHVSGGKPPHPHHPSGWSYMSPWYTASMPVETVTIADALKTNGYTTGHSGKWHMSMKHHGFPQPQDQGFDYTRGSRGVQSRMPNRLKGFATTDPKHPYRLDKNGFPFDQTTSDAMDFLDQSKGDPFFLYFATWLVHGPWHTYSEQLLNKYVEKLGVELTPEAKDTWKVEGQSNPFYCAMVEQLDYYIGGMIDYLKTTDDPRWPGHKLIENTYIIVSSDNGGMCTGGPKEIVTTNKPLQKGKISAMEGGTRVPLIVYGPNIPKDVKTDVMVNGLDFYPTILSLTGTKKPEGKHFDGVDLSKLLTTDPTNPELIKTEQGKVRDTMAWHFPNSAAQESTIRIGDYKLVRNYFDKPELELFRLYDSSQGSQKRVDIEEANNLAQSMPEKTAAMNAKLTAILTEMDASYPHLNPGSPKNPGRDKVPSVLSHSQSGKKVTVKFKENGSKLVRADLLYTKNGGDRYEEWFREEAKINADGTITARLPQKTTHYIINLIDSQNFLVSYPKIDTKAVAKKKQGYAGIAFPAK